ncbi:MAG: hypothetical protein E7117_02025 [Bacteroidales bacterium]|nr:hypothetical protein [Bacteroidales bacterium]
MKKLCLYLSVLSAAFVFFACSRPEVPENGGEEVAGPVVDYPDTILVEGDYPVPHPRIPMLVHDGKYNASADGVSVEVTEVEDKNITFVCRPGSNIESYAVNVYPLSLLYNMLMDNGALDTDVATVEDLILQIMFGSSLSGYAFNKESLDASWDEMEFDWMNTEYSAYLGIVPDAQYIIAVAASYDDVPGMTNVGELTLVYVESGSQELVGDPKVDIQVLTGYTAFRVNHFPNSDCAGFYYFGTDTYQVEEYVEIFGDRMFRDFIRHCSSPNIPVDAAATDQHSYKYEFPGLPDPDHSFITVAVAVDVNGTPEKGYGKEIFTVKATPGDADPAELSYGIKEVGASYAIYEMNLEASCEVGFHRVMTRHQADSIKNDCSPEQQEAFAKALSKGGWATVNENYGMDPDAGLLTGSSFVSTMTDISLEPETEYVIVYVGRNYYMSISDLHFSEPFTTKARVLDAPQSCLADFKFSFSDATRTSVTFDFQYDPFNTAKFYFIANEYIEFAYDPWLPAKDASHEEWMHFFFGKWPDDFDVSGVSAENLEKGDPRLIMVWEADDPSGHEVYNLPGFGPGEYVEYALVAEDKNGVVSEVLFADVTTTEVIPGPDPQVHLDYVFDSALSVWTVTIKAGKDTGKMRYVVSDDSAFALNYFLSETNYNYYRDKEYYQKWYTYVSQQGLPTDSESIVIHTEPGQNCVAGVVGFGMDGIEEVITPLNYIVLTADGRALKISDIFPNYVEQL